MKHRHSQLDTIFYSFIFFFFFFIPCSPSSLLLLSFRRRIPSSRFAVSVASPRPDPSSRSTAAAASPLSPRSACHRHCVSYFLQIRALCLLLCLDLRAATRLLLRSDPPSPLNLLLRPDLWLSPLFPLRDVHGRLSIFLFEFAIAASSSILVLFSQFALQLPSPLFYFSVEK
ncbi:hypothetical protein AHAS_Ahas11G0021900 [Arachis hypogaea]